MGHVIKDGAVTGDPWTYLGDEAPLAGRDIVVSLNRWLGDLETFIKHQGRVGVEIRTEDEIGPLETSLAYLDLVVINVPAIGDGRCYSLARLLRERYAYGGELRARGVFLSDQIQFMQRCGFSSYDPDAEWDLDEALRALNSFSVFYQVAADNENPAAELRHREQQAASVAERPTVHRRLPTRRVRDYDVDRVLVLR